MILDSIQTPQDIKKLSTSELKLLCQELREEIIRITVKNGGHLGSNLGTIELIVATHFVFNAPNDKIIFDVGHQCYAHKLLTGRRGIMENLRTEDGASGFLDPDESIYDCFISGHASTSLSAAVGFAVARDLQHQNNHTISIIGDGSMSGGMVYEAMNNIGNLKNFIIILNDNQMSISETVGGMRRYLSKLLDCRNLFSFRKKIRNILNKLPTKCSIFIEKIIKHSISALKGGTIFENLGIQYVGPINGHDLEALIKTLTNIRDYANYKPVIIHVVTKKGMGYKEAENDPYKLHGVVNNKDKQETFTDIFSKEIAEHAQWNQKIVCITAAMKSGCGLTEFSERFPDRFFDVGIAEEHAVTFAAGLAKSGLIPFVCIYSTFLQRAFDQIYHEVFLQNLPVRFIIDKAGFPGKDGKTHSGIYDIAMLSMFDNFHILAPSNKQDLKQAISFAVDNNHSPTAVRFPKSEIPEQFPFKSSSKDEVLIISVGAMLKIIEESLKILPIKATVYDIYRIQPFDFTTFADKIAKYRSILIIEDNIYGGFSANFLNALSLHKRDDIFKKTHIINIPKVPTIHSSRVEQYKKCGFTAEHITNILLDSLDN